mmetsp:Transcript_14981/g.25534  ORF Transcript_14981/g.25534 Transcript_14981/m.25534 type:complete len:612 (-) Transcript_14981:18-1853(-)
MADPRLKMRQMVSLKKKRFQEEGFDLDLAYITERIIAFGFPAEGRESMFRNPMSECKRFFDTYHKDKYYVYNLCIEKDRQYKTKKFYDRVAKFQWHDHNAPPLEMIPQFCKHAEDWMNEHPENIVAIHCKAGKGRTGVLICCLLLWLKKFDDPDEAMDFYGEQRTHNGKGVTIPSQKRFIRYFHKTITEGTPPPHTTSLLQKITVNGVSTFEDTHFALQIESNGSVIKYLKKGDKGLVYVLGKDSVTLDLGVVPVSGNTKVTLFKPGKKKELLVHFWFHCHYMTEPSFKMIKHEIDKAVSDRQHKVFPENFSIEVNFEPTGIYDDKKEVKQEKVDKKEESEGKSEEKESKSEDVEKKEEDEEEEEEEEEEKESKFTTKTSNPIPIPIGSVPRIGMVSPRLNTKKLRNRSKSTNLCPNTRRISPILSPRGIPSSFVGSLQESLLSGNLQGTKSSILNGFSATVCATSPHLGGSPARLKIPFDTMHYHLEDFNKTPYAGSIYLPKERYRIAKNGTLQVAILNPSGTLVKLFLVRYDLSSMKPNSKTFIRQITRNSDPPHVLQYAVQFTIICTKRGRLYLYKNIRVVFPHRKPDDLDKLEVICQSPDTPQYFQG